MAELLGTAAGRGVASGHGGEQRRSPVRLVKRGRGSQRRGEARERGSEARGIGAAPRRGIAASRWQWWQAGELVAWRSARARTSATRLADWRQEDDNAGGLVQLGRTVLGQRRRRTGCR